MDVLLSREESYPFPQDVASPAAPQPTEDLKRMGLMAGLLSQPIGFQTGSRVWPETLPTAPFKPWPPPSLS